MSSANKLLPLIQQRNKKRNKLITKINDSLLRDLSSTTIKNYHGSFEQKGQSFQKFILSKDKDQQTVSLAKKYLQRFQQKKKSLGKIACLHKNSSNNRKTQKIKTIESCPEDDQKQRQKLLKIQALIKSLSVSRKQQKSPVNVEKDNSIVPHLPCEEMRRMKRILFSNERRKSFLKSKQELIDKYGSLKTKVSKSLQNEIKVNKYKSSRYNKQDSIRIHNKMLAQQQQTVTLIAKNPQKSYKYDCYDDQEDRIMKTLDKNKYQYFSTPKRLKFNPLKSPKIKSQNCSKKNLSYRLDSFEPWEDHTESRQIQ